MFNDVIHQVVFQARGTLQWIKITKLLALTDIIPVINRGTIKYVPRHPVTAEYNDAREGAP